jgi:D-3-phosphoglycerate dehydrogenase
VAAVNLPFPPGGDPHAALPWMRLSERVGEFLGRALHAAPKSIAISLAGVPDQYRKACAVSAVKGVLTPFCAEGVNIVNAPTLARQRGVSVTETVKGEGSGYANLVKVVVSTAVAERSAAGTLFSDRHGRVVEIDGLPLEFSPDGTLLVIANEDVPGVVGRIGTLLGERGVNIADFALARGRGGKAAAVVKVDVAGADARGLVEAVAALPGIASVRLVDLS